MWQSFHIQPLGSYSIGVDTGVDTGVSTVGPPGFGGYPKLTEQQNPHFLLCRRGSSQRQTGNERPVHRSVYPAAHDSPPAGGCHGSV